MSTVRAGLLIALVAALAAPPPLAAQGSGAGGGRERLEILLPPPASNGLVDVGEGPRISIGSVLGEGQIPELVRSGFPAHIRARLELWRVGNWYDENETTVEWDIIVGYDPATQSYRVRRRFRNQLEDLGGYATLAAAELSLERPFRVPLVPKVALERYYYQLVVDIEALSVSDLDQLERWLRGDLRPAVSGRRNPLAALGRGVKLLVTRALGGERRHYERRSPTFRAERGAGG